MMRFALAFVLIAACSGKSKQGTQSGTGTGSSTVLAKKILLSWGIQQGASSAEIFLQTTDETGRQVSHSIGTFNGQCATSSPAPEMKAVIGVSCVESTGSVELHAVVRDPDVIVVKGRVEAGTTLDPMAREEVTRVRIPLGAAVSAG